MHLFSLFFWFCWQLLLLSSVPGVECPQYLHCMRVYTSAQLFAVQRNAPRFNVYSHLWFLKTSVKKKSVLQYRNSRIFSLIRLVPDLMVLDGEIN